VLNGFVKRSSLSTSTINAQASAGGTNSCMAGISNTKTTGEERMTYRKASYVINITFHGGDYLYAANFFTIKRNQNKKTHGLIRRL